MPRKCRVFVINIIVMSALGLMAYAEEAKPQQGSQKYPQDAQGLDMVSDTVASVFNKANALLSGDLEVTMSKKVDSKDDYTINAMGQRVPRRTAIKSGGALHNDQPL